jgi:two-component system LytT family response regulator
MAFTTVFTLHKVAVYTICIFIADTLAHHLVPSWGGYRARTVGRQALIWSLGLAVGFVLQQTMVRRLVPLYAPEVIDFFIARRQPRIGNLTLLMVLIPYWTLVMFVTLKVALSRQRIQQVVDALVVPDALPRIRSAWKETSNEASSAAESKKRPLGILRLTSGNGNGNGVIALADITHVTVEDHYCRVNYATGNGLKSEMIRLPLKKMMQKLPEAYFLRVHRSHVVNVEHIARLAKSGRDHHVVLRRFDVQLPVSRSRFKDLLPRLNPAGTGN